MSFLRRYRSSHPCVRTWLIVAALFAAFGARLATVAAQPGAPAAPAESSAGGPPPAEVDVTVAPMVVVRERPGITGAGWVSTGFVDATTGRHEVRLLYPNHPDDWGKSAGTGSSVSSDGGLTWTPEPDDTPLPKMVDQWCRTLWGGEMIAFGVRRVPDPKSRSEPAPTPDAESAWVVGHSFDRGATWKISDSTIECPASLGVIARPLPPVLEAGDGTLVMPAYAWSPTGSRALLLSSKNRGRHWSVWSTITDATAIRAAGVPVTTPWMETTIARTGDGGWLAVVRTGSSSKATLMQVRSADGRSWEPPVPLLAGPKQRPVAGKLPSLVQLASGPLVLLTAHTNNHCRLYISSDGTGRRWSEGFVVTSQSGGNTCLAAVGDDRLVVITPANNRLHAWPLTLRVAGKGVAVSPIGPPSDVRVAAGPNVRVTWSAPASAENVVRYRVTPHLVAAGNPETEVYPYATIETANASTHLDLGRVVSIGGRYRFRVAALDREGRITEAAESRETVVGLATPPAAP